MVNLRVSYGIGVTPVLVIVNPLPLPAPVSTVQVIAALAAWQRNWENTSTWPLRSTGADESQAWTQAASGLWPGCQAHVVSRPFASKLAEYSLPR